MYQELLARRSFRGVWALCVAWWLTQVLHKGTNMEVALEGCARDPHNDMAREFCRRGGVQLYNAVLFELNVKALLHAPIIV